MKLRVTLGGQWSAWETEWGSSGLVYGRKGPMPVSSLRVPGGLSGGGCLPRKEGRGGAEDTIRCLLGTG